MNIQQQPLLEDDTLWIQPKVKLVNVSKYLKTKDPKLINWVEALILEMNESFLKKLESATAEEHLEIDVFVLEKVFTLLSQWHNITPIAVNIFQSSFIHEKISELLHKYKDFSKFLDIELLEYGHIQDINKIWTHIREYQRLGYHIWIDDFPRWFNNTVLLADNRISLNFIKIDRDYAIRSNISGILGEIDKILNMGFIGDIIIEWVETEKFCNQLKQAIDTKLKLLYDKTLEIWDKTLEIWDDTLVQKLVYNIHTLQEITLQWYVIWRKTPIQTPTIK